MHERTVYIKLIGGPFDGHMSLQREDQLRENVSFGYQRYGQSGWQAVYRQHHTETWIFEYQYSEPPLPWWLDTPLLPLVGIVALLAALIAVLA